MFDAKSLLLPASIWEGLLYFMFYSLLLWEWHDSPVKKVFGDAEDPVLGRWYG